MRGVLAYSICPVSGKRKCSSANMPGFTHGGWCAVVWAAVANR